MTAAVAMHTSQRRTGWRAHAASPEKERKRADLAPFTEQGRPSRHQEADTEARVRAIRVVKRARTRQTPSPSHETSSGFTPFTQRLPQTGQRHTEAYSSLFLTLPCPLRWDEAFPLRDWPFPAGLPPACPSLPSRPSPFLRSPPAPSRGALPLAGFPAPRAPSLRERPRLLSPPSRDDASSSLRRRVRVVSRGSSSSVAARIHGGSLSPSGMSPSAEASGEASGDAFTRGVAS